MYLVKYRRCIKGPLSHVLPALDKKCSPNGCWYCSNVCQHCMQPSATLYSGVYEDNLLKFCSEECKGFWFPTSDQKSIRVASHLDETSQLNEEMAPTMTIIIPKDNTSVEQIYLSVDETSGRPFIVWHVRGVQHHFLAHFYISTDCLPLNSVWPKQYSTFESEFIGKYIATEKLNVQSSIQMQLNQAAKECGLEDFNAFLKQIMNPKGISLYDEMSVMPPEEVKRAAIQSNLPTEFIFCSPELGFAQNSLKRKPVTDLLHYTEVDDSFQTVYLLSMTDIFDPNSPLKLQLVFIKHHQEEGWYFADGAVLSIDATCAINFLLDEPFYDRGPQPIEEMNRVVQRIIPKMLRKSGIPSIQPLIRLLKYSRISDIEVKPDLLCSASSNCWFCKSFCLWCSKIHLNEQYCDECNNLKFSATSTDILKHTDLEAKFAPKKSPVIAFMKKVFSSDSDGNTILRIYLSRSDGSLGSIPVDTPFAICQIKTASTQVVIDCLLSNDYVPLEPIWYSDYCERMIDKHRAFLHREIAHLATQTT